MTYILDLSLPLCGLMEVVLLAPWFLPCSCKWNLSTGFQPAFVADAPPGLVQAAYCNTLGNTRHPTFCGSQMDHWFRERSPIPPWSCPPSVSHLMSSSTGDHCLDQLFLYELQKNDFLILSFLPHVSGCVLLPDVIRNQRMTLTHKSCSEWATFKIHTYKISFLKRGKNSEDSAFNSESKSERGILKIISSRWHC